MGAMGRIEGARYKAKAKPNAFSLNSVLKMSFVLFVSHYSSILLSLELGDKAPEKPFDFSWS